MMIDIALCWLLQVPSCVGYLTCGQQRNATISEGNWHRKCTQMLSTRQTHVEHALGLCVGACFPRLE